VYTQAYTAEYEKWKTDYEEVKSIGGLYVIGTERHESRRIDNQLRGRSGRQGDPGKSKFFISMDDDLMRLFGGENIKGIMARMGMEGGEPIYHPWLNKSIEKAQTKVEERNFEIRKHLLEYDDVLNQQRKYIYEQRDAILNDSDLKKRVNDATADMVGTAIDSYSTLSKRDNAEALKELLGYLKEKFNFIPSSGALPSDGIIKNPPDFEEQLLRDLEEDIKNKETLLGPEVINAFIRAQYLQFIDRQWLDHLENMESLREAVYLRGYAQKNPLTEYKLEGFQIFDTMIDNIRQEIASRIHLVRIQAAGDRETRGRMQIQSANHGTITSFGGGSSGSGSAGNQRQGAAQGTAPMPRPSQGARGEAGLNATVVRAQPKVGRNDPCPCGSGKKYKHCHGR
jgi:preprotein translocase subunit SecA